MKGLVLKSINLQNSVKHNFTFDFGRYGSAEETTKYSFHTTETRVHVTILYTKKERVVGIHSSSFTGKELLLAHQKKLLFPERTTWPFMKIYEKSLRFFLKEFCHCV